MKKKKNKIWMFIILLALAIFTVPVCMQVKAETTKYTEKYYKWTGKKWRLYSYEEEFYRKNGTLKKEKSTHYEKGKKSSYTESIYDKNGNLKEEKSTDYEKGKKKSTVVEKYTYNKHGDLTGTKKYRNGKKWLSEKIKYKYDKNGRKIYEEADDYVTEYQYDNNGRLLQRKEFDTASKKKWVWTSTFSYDEKGNLVQYKRTIGHEKNGKKTSSVKEDISITYEYRTPDSPFIKQRTVTLEDYLVVGEYNTNNQLIKETWYEKDKEEKTVKFVNSYEYYSNGSLKIYNGHDGYVELYSNGMTKYYKFANMEIKYDKNGNCTYGREYINGILRNKTDKSKGKVITIGMDNTGNKDSKTVITGSRPFSKMKALPDMISLCGTEGGISFNDSLY